MRTTAGLKLSNQPPARETPIIYPLSMLARVRETGPTIVRSSYGIFIEEESGRWLIDAYSGSWSVNAGHGRREIAEAAFEQMCKLPYASSMYGYTNEPAVALAHKLVQITPESLTRVHFTIGGSDAIDTAIKMIILYNNLTGQTQRKNMISLQGAYHGLTLAASGLTNLSECQRFYDVPFSFQHVIEAYHPFRCCFGDSEEEIIAGTLQALDAKISELGEGTVAAFFCEPFKQTGGAIFPPKGWLKAIERYCRSKGILFVLDEVISGFGRTGRMFAAEHEDVQPDMMTIAKGLTSSYAPMGALMVSEEIFEAISDGLGRDEFFGHGFTGAGHPVSATVANKAIEIYEREDLAGNAARVGAFLCDRLQFLRDYDHVYEVRGQGMVVAIDLVENRTTCAACPPAWDLFNAIRDAGYRHGITLRAYEQTTVPLAPPLTLTFDEADMIVAKTKAVFDEVIPQLGK